MNDLLANSPLRSHSSRYIFEWGNRSKKSEPDFGNFYEKVKEVEQLYEDLNTLLMKLKDANNKSKIVITSEDVKAIKHQMEQDVNEVGRIALSVKSKIDALDRDNLASRRKAGCEEGSAVDRTRTTTILVLKKKFKDSMSKFQTLREKMQQEYREVIERRVFAVTGAKPDEETIDNLIETGGSEQILHKSIRQLGKGMVIESVAEIQERHNAVRDLEKGLLDLHKIFVDLSVVVEAQGDMLNNIESQVNTSIDHVESGYKSLRKTKGLQKSSRKWMCVGILVFSMIVAIVLVGVLKLFHSKNGA